MAPSLIQTRIEEGLIQNQTEIDAWIDKDAYASGLIHGSIETTYQTSVEGSATAAEIWQLLNQEYAQVAAANTGQLTARFFQYFQKRILLK